MIFHKAIRKYGIADFKWKVVFKSNNYLTLSLAEAELIQYYNTIQEGYNINKGMESNISIDYNSPTQTKQREVAKRNILREQLGSKFLPETRDKISKSNSGKKRTSKQKDFMSKQRTKNYYRLFSPDGGVYVINSLKKFCNIFNLQSGNMYSVARGEIPHYKQWRAEICPSRI